jgi:hypothetical protein
MDDTNNFKAEELEQVTMSSQADLQLQDTIFDCPKERYYPCKSQIDCAGNSRRD